MERQRRLGLEDFELLRRLVTRAHDWSMSLAIKRALAPARRMLIDDRSDYILPFTYESAYRTYLSTAYALGIVSARGPVDYLLATRYCNLASTPEALILIDRGACPLYIAPWNVAETFAGLGYFEIEEYRFARNARSLSAIVDCIRGSIRQGKYVLCSVNEVYVPETQRYLDRMPRMHVCLLTGWRGPSREVDIFTYRYDGSFGQIVVPLEAISRALMLTVSEGAEENQTRREVVLKQIDCKDGTWQGDPSSNLQIQGSLASYLKSHDCYGNGKLGIKYGVQALDYYLSSMRHAVQRGGLIDLRGTRVIMEHKAIVHGVLRYLGDRTSRGVFYELHRDYSKVAAWGRKLHLLSFSRAASEGPREVEDTALIESLDEWQGIRSEEIRIMRAAILCSR